MKRNFKRLMRSKNHPISWFRSFINRISGHSFPFSCLRCGEKNSKNTGFCKSCGFDQFIDHSEYIFTPNLELIEEKNERDKIQKQRKEERENEIKANVIREKVMKLAEDKWRELFKSKFCHTCLTIINSGDYCEKCGNKLVILDQEEKKRLLLKEFRHELSTSDLSEIFTIKNPSTK